MENFIDKVSLKVGKKFLHDWSKITSNIGIRERHSRVFRNHPEYKHPVDSTIEKTHIQLWKAIRNNINLDTLRLCSNLSGLANPSIIPEEVFASDIQISLCGRQENLLYIANKSFYYRWFKTDRFPTPFLHNIDRSFYDPNYEKLSEQEAKKIIQNLSYPVVLKPNKDSMGGANVFFPQNQKELESQIKYKKNYIIQELIKPHDFFAKYNRDTLNTIRVNLYRSVITNDIQYLHSVLRLAKSGNLVDNETAGGIVCFIYPDGRLNHYAVDKYGNKNEKHSDTNIRFSDDKRIPAFEEMKNIAADIAKDVYLARLISLDMCLDQQQRWRIIEINLNDITIRHAQYAGVPFFGQFTEEIIDYCKKNPWWK